MNERVAAFRVGIVVIAAAFVTGFLIILLGEGRSLLQGRYTVYVKFKRAPGVAVDTPVRKQGVLIGRVTHIELRDQGDVMITARIDAGRKLYTTDKPRISSSSLLGDAVIEFVPPDESDQPKKLVQDGDYLGEGDVATDPIQMLANLEGNVRNAADSLAKAGDSFSSLTTRLNQALGTENDQLPRLMNKTELALDKFYTTMSSVDELIGDQELRNKLKQGLADLPVTLEEMRVTMGKARDSLDSFQSMQQKAEKNLENIERFTRPLGDRGEELVNNVNNVLKNLDVMTAEVADLSKRISRSDGSIAKLIRDDEMYNKILETVENLNDASRRIRPILEDVRVFTDKIATDPRQLGVKGALDHKPLGVGVKGVPNFRGSWLQGPVEE